MKTTSSRRGKHLSPPATSPVSTTRCLHPADARIFITLALLVATVVAAVHWPALDARALSFDDGEYLADNALVQHPSLQSAHRFLTEMLKPSTVQGYYQPLAMISLMLDYAVAGRADNLRPFHRTSLMLHVANTLLIMSLLYALFGRPWIAAGVAMLFGVHPMTVETIQWIGERKTLLAAFFALWCLTIYVRYARRPNWKLWLTCLVLYVLALMSKPISTPLPVVLLLLDFWPLGRLSRRVVVEKIPFLLIAGGSAIVAVVSQRHLELSVIQSFSAGQTFLLMCHNLIFYPWHIIWPVHLSSFYTFPENISLSDGMLLTGVIVNAAILVLLLISLRWTRALLAGWLCYFILLSPTLLNKGYSPSVAWDKYAYLPAVGLLLILSWALEWVWTSGTERERRSRWIGTAACVVVVAALLTLGTRQYLHEWHTTERHEFYMLGLAPNSPYVLFGCGNVLDQKGEHERAISFYNRAIDLKPDFAKAYNNRGNVYSNTNDYDRAIRDYTRAIELKPNYTKAYNNRGNAYSNTRDYGQAIHDYTRAIELNPGLAVAYYNRGNTFSETHDYGRAIQDYGKAIESKPDYADAYNYRGIASCEINDYGSAIRDYTRAIDLMPNFATAYNNRSIAHFRLGEYGKAWADVQKCKQLGGEVNPDFIRALTQASSRPG